MPFLSGPSARLLPATLPRKRHGVQVRALGLVDRSGRLNVDAVPVAAEASDVFGSDLHQPGRSGNEGRGRPEHGRHLKAFGLHACPLGHDVRFEALGP